MDNNKKVLDVQNISKNYNDLQALNDISFSWDGGIMGLIGPNGAGKSTLIKILSTLIRPTKGNGFVYGKAIIKEPLEVKKRIGVLHENPIFNPRFTVMDSLIWVGQIRGMNKNIAEERVLELLELFDLIKAKQKSISQLSAGMKQKYGLLYATIGNPSLIILDEPTSNLDPDARKLYENYVIDMKETNSCNFLISSHILGELDRLCSDFIFLFNGSIAKSGKREEIAISKGKKRYKISTDDPQSLLPYLVNHGCIVERVLTKEIYIKGVTEDQINKIPIQVKEEGFNKPITIIPLETDTETLYNHLSQKYRQM